MDEEMIDILEGLGDSVGILIRLTDEVMRDYAVKDNFGELTFWNGISKGLALVQMRIDTRLKDK